MNIIAEAASENQTINITSSTADSYIISTPSWISVGEKTDTYFILNIKANTSKSTRLGSVTITASAAGKDDKEINISVTQRGIALEPIEPKPLEPIEPKPLE